MSRETAWFDLFFTKPTLEEDWAMSGRREGTWELYKSHLLRWWCSDEGSGGRDKRGACMQGLVYNQR